MSNPAESDSQPGRLATAAARPGPARRGFRPWVWIAWFAAVVLLTLVQWRGIRIRTLALDSIAVLPVQDLSSEQDLGDFGDALVDQVCDDLTAIPNLRVIARGSTMRYATTPANLREIGQSLGATSILETSVTRSSGKVRVTLQLMRASNGQQVWSQTIESEAGNPFAIQNEVARHVTNRIAPNRALLDKRPPKDAAAYELYVQARIAWSNMPGGLEHSEVRFRQSLAIDPDFALAWNGLAEAYCSMMEYELAPPPELAAKAREAADRALALDPSLAEAHTARGIVAIRADWDWDRAGRELSRAVELRPGYAYGLRWYAQYLEYNGRAAEGLPKMQEAHTLDPLNVIIDDDLGFSFYLNRKYARALDHFERIARERPADFNGPYGLAMTYLAMGRPRDALAPARRLDEFPKIKPLALAVQSVAESAGGDGAKAKILLDELKGLSAANHQDAEGVARAYLSLGDLDNAAAWFDRAVAERAPGLFLLKSDPQFDPYRKDPRFRAVLARLNLN